MPRITIENCIHCGVNLEPLREEHYRKKMKGKSLLGQLWTYLSSSDPYFLTCARCDRAIELLHQQRCAREYKEWQIKRDAVLEEHDLR